MSSKYNFKEIEPKWQKRWSKDKVFKADNNSEKPKYYVLDMFPYPSGAGLHVGHPLGYIASDIFARYKRLSGFNVLHPMGYDAYGLPAEQYAVKTGQHPAVTTEQNINRYREQLDRIGFSFDWDREVRTCNPGYYKWTQWVFIEMFNHYYDFNKEKAVHIDSLTSHFEQNGTDKLNIAQTEEICFSAKEWRAMSENEKDRTLLNYRIAYKAETMVNWCPELGTVLANDEVVDGLSVRGGHVVLQKKMEQWCLRVSAYSKQLLEGLEELDWSESLKDQQRNWIGRSEGAEMTFKVDNSDIEFEIFTTRADTVYGVTFMVLAPESEYVQILTTAKHKPEVDNYIKETQKRTERERMSDTKNVTGIFTGSYAINPLTNGKIPIWISDYVLAGYGTGAIMAVPAHDSRDFLFAKKFKLPIRQVVVPPNENPSNPDHWENSIDAKEGTMVNSGVIDGLNVAEAIEKAKDYIEDRKIGKRKINYRLRDAIFSRQRYWGEPFPIYYEDGLPRTLSYEELPLELPQVDKYAPTPDGDPPLGNAKGWQYANNKPYELNTMPGFAGSSAYYLRYMDAHNTDALVSKDAVSYWRNVDLYIGGREHATGHLIYSRFWNKFLFDLGITVEKEPFKKLVNQGMIQGRSNFVYRIKDSKPQTFVTLEKTGDYDTSPIHVDVNIVENDILDIDKFKKSLPEYAKSEFILNDNGNYTCGYAVEKMSKSLYNVVNPDLIIEKYGADTMRMYEMFLGPLEQSKPWDTKGIDGVFKFLRRFWNLFHDKNGNLCLSKEKPTAEEQKTLHKTIKKVQHDIENFSFNTSVSAFMICANELTEQKCNKVEILDPLLIILSPFAPHITEELWHKLGKKESINYATFPMFNEDYLVESKIVYPVQINGKMRFKLNVSANTSKAEIEKLATKHEHTHRWLEGKTIRKVIVVPNKIINIVIG
ncbi:MAG: leucine--tRNA ligase [Bacteroidales bacterium]